MLEQEVTDYLGRERYQRRDPAESHRGYRNGYEPGRMRTTEGEIRVQVPQVREASETYHSDLMDALQGNSVLERLAVQMYTRGLSTRDIEEALQSDGRSLSQDYQAFCQRDLSGFARIPVLGCGVRGLASKGVVRRACCVLGRSVPMGARSAPGVGNKESYQRLDFLRDMLKRGLGQPVLITTDGAPGLVRAVESHSLRQRCLVHKVRNVDCPTAPERK
jgi:putative transposase